MRKIKNVLSAILFLAMCLSVFSCQSNHTFEVNETDTTDDMKTNGSTDTDNEICFEEISYTDDLFTGMTEVNFWDVTDFSVGISNGAKNPLEFTPTVHMSYIPLLMRPWEPSNAYFHNNERFSHLKIDSYYVTNCLERIMNVEPIRALKPDSNQKDAVLSAFLKKFGVSYSLEFIHNIERSEDDFSIIEQQTHYNFLVSPLTKNNTYYLYNRDTLMLTEIDGESLSFLKNSSEDWYDKAIFLEHIGFVNKIEISLKDGTTDGIRGVTDLLLEHSNTDTNGVVLHPLDVIEAGPNAVLHVMAHYNGKTTSITDIPKYRTFYQVILLSSVDKVVSNESWQEHLKTISPEMTIKVYRRYDNQQRILEYSFFADNSVLFNDVYIGKLTDGQLDKLISAVGLMLSPDANDIIH